MSAIVYKYKCADCQASFTAPEVPEDSYGLFVMRSERVDDAAYLDTFNDAVFLESYDLLKQCGAVVNLDAERRGELQQAIFPVTCDQSPHGDSFKIGLLPKCPICGSRKMDSWEPAHPIQEWNLPFVGHAVWNLKTLNERVAFIDHEVRCYLRMA